MAKYVLRRKNRAVGVLVGILLILLSAFLSAQLIFQPKNVETIERINSNIDILFIAMFVSLVFVCFCGGLGIGGMILLLNHEYVYEYTEEIEMEKIKSSRW